jgi:hypothetical protein
MKIRLKNMHMRSLLRRPSTIAVYGSPLTYDDGGNQLNPSLSIANHARSLILDHVILRDIPT